MSISIREARDSDWSAIWAILEPVFRAGETYPYPRDISENETRHTWMSVPQATYVAADASGEILGTYYLKPNQPGLGSHVCNCGYVVSERARGKGVASLMCEHSQEEGHNRGYQAMQFNLVVSTNAVAVRLWQHLGFAIIGTLPGAFNHPTQGYVDAYVMYKKLTAA